MLKKVFVGMICFALVCFISGCSCSRNTIEDESNDEAVEEPIEESAEEEEAEEQPTEPQRTYSEENYSNSSKPASCQHSDTYYYWVNGSQQWVVDQEAYSEEVLVSATYTCSVCGYTISGSYDSVAYNSNNHYFATNHRGSIQRHYEYVDHPEEGHYEIVDGTLQTICADCGAVISSEYMSYDEGQQYL